jgi:hypothetical protein
MALAIGAPRSLQRRVHYNCHPAQIAVTSPIRDIPSQLWLTLYGSHIGFMGRMAQHFPQDRDICCCQGAE